jgi:transposase
MVEFKEGLDRKQELLMPSKIEDYIEDNHLAKLVVAICAMLNLLKIEAKYSEKGQHAYNPQMMVALLFYGYSIGIRSSRKLQSACRERLDFMYITQGLKPSHDRISDFRKENFEELKEVFQEIVMIGATLGLTELGNIKTSIDGTKIRANASPKLSKDEDGLEKLLEKTQKEISRLLEEAEKIDEMEDEKYGKKTRCEEIPKELQSKESREKAIKEALEILKEQKEQKKKEIEKEKGREPTEAELKKVNKMKINITDMDARFMKERQGVIKPNYNCQIAVDEKEQFIVANDVTIECNDQHQLIPMTQKSKDNLGESPKQVKADNGYYSQLKSAIGLFPETDFYVDDKNRRKEDLDMKEIRESYDDIAYENLVKLMSEDGSEEYKKRMHTAEPPFGNLKFNLGYRYFLLRGGDKVSGEFNLMCIGHNLKKILSSIMKSGKDILSAVKEILKTKRICTVNLS